MRRNQKGIQIKLRNVFAMSLVALVLTPAVFAGTVSVDYDHSENFAQVKTYFWTTVSTANSLWDKRVKDAVDRELTARGYTQVVVAADAA
jgi:hypothetical protein